MKPRSQLNPRVQLAFGSAIAILLVRLKVVADGVETKEQSRLLQLLSCDEMQGILFSKPVPCEIFEAKYLIRLPPGDEEAGRERLALQT
jgi:predicted signal transduction protein with EAL and GGDEF domain